MEYVITTDGLLKKDDYIVPPFEILSKLPEWLTLEDDLTFRQLLTFFNNYPDLYHVQPELEDLAKHVNDVGVSSEDEQFLSVYQSCSLTWSSRTVKDMLPADDQDKNSKFTRMEFSYEDKPSMHENMYYGVHLTMPNSEEKHYSLTFTPITEIIDLPIRLGDNEYMVGIEREYKNLNKPMSGCSLYDLIEAVLSSIMFFGSEENKQAQYDILKERIDEVDEEFDEDDE